MSGQPKYLAIAGRARRYRAERREASDPATPIDRLLKLGERWPGHVLANPAWQLAAVADGAVARRVTDAMVAESVKTVPLDDIACIRACDAWFDSSGTKEQTMFALASHADAPLSWLRSISIHAPPNRCAANGLEIALHRSRLGAGDFRGWAAAALPTLSHSLRHAVPNALVLQRDEALVAFLHHGVVDLDQPFALVAGIFGSPSLRDGMLAFAREEDVRWVAAIATANSGYDPFGEPSEWRVCTALWEGVVDHPRALRRFGARTFAEGMALGMRNQATMAAIEKWRCGDLPRRPLPEQVMPLDDAILAAACSGPRSGALMVLLSLPLCPIGLLRMHARSEEPCVRAAVASNPALPAAMRECLARDWHWIVRGAALGHEPWRGPYQAPESEAAEPTGRHNVPEAPGHAFADANR